MELSAPATTLRRRDTGFLLLTRCGRMLLMGLTPQQFKILQERLSGAKRVAAPLVPSIAASPPVGPGNVILGIDPSLRGTGYGVIELAKPRPRALAHGALHCPPSWEHSRCLARIAQELRDVIRTYKPTICVVEGLFFAKNLQTALTMGEARGAALATVGEAGLRIYELAARKVKLAIVGYGAAQKLAVAKMVQRMLDLPEPPEPDAADALALALAHAQEHSRYSLAVPKRI